MGFAAILLFSAASLGWGESFKTKEPALWSLRCVYAGQEACDSALSDYILPVDNANETFPELEKIFTGMEQTAKDFFVRRKFAAVSPAMACQVPKPLLLLLPAEYLSELKGDVLGRLLGCNVDDLAIVRLIADSVQDLVEPYPFYLEVQSLNLNENVLSILGKEIKSLKSITTAQWLVSQHQSAIEYLDPEIIIEDNYNLFQLMRNMDPVAWGKRPQRVKRIWAYVLPKFIHPLKLTDWDDSHIEGLGHLLLGSTVRELNALSPNRILNKTRLFNHPFSLIQTRGLFNSFYRYSVQGKAVYLQIRGSLHKLLPSHLQQFNEGSLDFLDHTKYLEPTSLATSRQIVEYIVGNATSGNSSVTKETFVSLNQLLYSLPLSTFRRLPFNLTFKELLPLQHHKLSAGQLYYLTGRGSVFRLTIDGIHGAHDLLRGIPTQLLSRAPPTAVYAYLMSELPGSVPPRMAALLDHFVFSKTGSVTEKNFRSIFKNKDARKYLDLLPSKYVERHFETILQALQHYSSVNPDFFNEIPDHVLSVLLTKALDRQFGWEKFATNNANSSYPLLLRGLTCSDVNRLAPVDFIHVISRFNSLKSTYGWKFPKNLQKCSLVKFAEYLQMKSAFMTHYLGTSLVSLMSPSDVEAVGGFVLADLPIMEIRSSPVRDLIVKEIGSLSLPELLVAARADKLADIGELYYRPKLGKNLFNLGNLTAFLNVASIRSVDPADFKLMLESGYLDKRVCALDTQRDAWSNLILDAFGSADRWTAQDLVTLGDMLVVVPHHDLSRVSPHVWAEAADIISNTGYLDTIAASDSHLPFHEACEKMFSDTYEATTYRRELSEFVGWLLMAAQYQMDTVLRAKSIAKGERSSPIYKPRSSDPFDFDKPDKPDDQRDFWSKIFPFSTLRERDGNQGGYATKLSCDAIKTVGKPAGLFLSLTSINEMDVEEIENCKEDFGKMDLSREMSLLIWTKLNKQWAPHLAGTLLSQAASTDVIGWNLSFAADKWSHETVYHLAYHNNDKDTISTLLNMIDAQKLSLLSVEQVVALGPLTCRLSGPRVTPNVFFKASRHLGAHLPCSLSCLGFFASSFQNVDAYGPISSWTPEDVESLGILIAGLDLEEWTTLVENPKLLSRIGSRAVGCLPKSHLQMLTEPAVQHLPYTTATYLLNELGFDLNSTVKAALELHVAPHVDLQTPDAHQIVYVWRDNRYQPSVVVGSAPIAFTDKMLMWTLVPFYFFYYFLT